MMTFDELSQVLVRGPTMMEIRDEVAVLEQLMAIAPGVAAKDLPGLRRILEHLAISRSASIFQFRQDDEALVHTHKRLSAWLTSVAAEMDDAGVASYLDGVARELTITADAAFGSPTHN